MHPTGYIEKPTDVGKRLKELRGSFSQAEFAQRIGVSLPAYQRYEYGERVPHPHVLSKVARLCDTTVDWILTGDLKIDKAIILDKAKETLYLQDLVEKLEEGVARRLRLRLTAARVMGSTEEKEEVKKISKFFEIRNEEKLLDFVRGWTRAVMEEATQVKHFEQISRRSPLYSLFRRIEEIYNKGDRAKFDAIKSFLDTLD